MNERRRVLDVARSRATAAISIATVVLLRQAIVPPAAGLGSASTIIVAINAQPLRRSAA